MTITAPPVEASPEVADAALKRAKSLLPVWTPLVRAIARDSKLEVKLTGGAPRTDGKIVWLRVPLMLGFTDHVKLDCGKWDEEINGFKCPACNVELECDVNLFHEVAHLTAGSFAHDDPDDELIDLLISQYPEQAHRFDAVAMRIKGTGVRRNQSNTLLQRVAQRLPDQWGFFTFNAVEDVYVNANILSVRPGLVKIFAASTEAIFRDGVLQDDGSVMNWGEAHPFLQALVGWSLRASGQGNLIKYLDDEVMAVISLDPVLRNLEGQVLPAEVVGDRFKVAMRLLARLKELDLGPVTPPPSPTPPPNEGDDEDEGKPSEGGQQGTPPQESESQDSEDGSNGQSDSQEKDEGSNGESDEDSDSDEGDADEAEGEGEGEGGTSDDDPEDDDEANGHGRDEGDDDGDQEGDEASDGTSTQVGDDGGIREPSTGQTAPSKGSTDDEGDSEDGDAADGEADQEGDEDGDEDGFLGNTEADLDGTSPYSEAPDKGDNEQSNPHNVEVDHGSDGDGTTGEVELDMDAARKAMEAFTGHDSFGDIEEMVEAFKPDEPPVEETRLIETTVKFDGHIEGSTRGLNDLIMEGESFRYYPNAGGAPAKFAGEAFSGDPDPDRYKLPVEIRVSAGQSMRLAFTENRRSGVERNLRTGKKFDARTMGAKIPVGDDRIFTRRSIPRQRDWTVLIGLDISGSTAGPEIEVEKMIAIGIGDLLTEVGIPFSMYAHTATRPKNRPYDGDSITKVYDLIILPVKKVNETWKEGRAQASRLGACLENLDGHTMQVYRKMLERQQGKDKLLMYFTDGQMPAANRTVEKPVLENETAMLRAKGIHAIGVGIGTDSPRQYGLDTIRVDGVQDVPALIKGVGERLSRPA